MPKLPRSKRVNFDDYVLARGDALLRFAYLLCADAQRAEDFVQEALVRCHRRWRRIEHDAGLDAYVRKTILRQFLSWRRRKAADDVPTDRFDERGGQDDMVEAIGERDAMHRLLAQLPRRQRAVLVLRYYEDLPDQRIAELLGCSAATVRVHASRGLAHLRRHPDLVRTGAGRRMSSPVSTSRLATAPQGNVTQPSHKHVTKHNHPSPNATNTLKSGEAEQS